MTSLDNDEGRLTCPAQRVWSLTRSSWSVTWSTSIITYETEMSEHTICIYHNRGTQPPKSRVSQGERILVEATIRKSRVWYREWLKLGQFLSDVDTFTRTVINIQHEESLPFAERANYVNV